MRKALCFLRRSRVGINRNIGTQGRLMSTVSSTTECEESSSDVNPDCPVSSHTEWDPLEEVIVGRPQGARIPKLAPEIKALTLPENWHCFANHAGQVHEPERTQRASDQADELCRILELEGVTVRRPEIVDWQQLGDFDTPDFTEGGFMAACPRDSLVVIGNEIIEAAMSWRSRYFETRPYKRLLNEYFHRGAKWTVAPKPALGDDLYVKDFPYKDMEKRKAMCREGKYILTEVEPCFDAADIFRAGKDIFVQISLTTNWSGFKWLKRHLSPKYRVHSLNVENPLASHIDCTLMPLRPGLLLANPISPCYQADMFKKAGWDIIQAPEPTTIDANIYTSHWLSINTLNIDEERVIVYSKEQPIIDMFKKLGMKPIPVEFTDAFYFGGAFHCWTVDIRRRGPLKSYFDW